MARQRLPHSATDGQRLAQQKTIADHIDALFVLSEYPLAFRLLVIELLAGREGSLGSVRESWVAAEQARRSEAATLALMERENHRRLHTFGGPLTGRFRLELDSGADEFERSLAPWVKDSPGLAQDFESEPPCAPDGTCESRNDHVRAHAEVCRWIGGIAAAPLTAGADFDAALRSLDRHADLRRAIELRATAIQFVREHFEVRYREIAMYEWVRARPFTDRPATDRWLKTRAGAYAEAVSAERATQKARGREGRSETSSSALSARLDDDGLPPDAGVSRALADPKTTASTHRVRRSRP